MPRILRGPAARKLDDVWSVPRHLPEVVVAAGRIADCPFLTDAEVDVLAIPIAPALEADDGLEPRHGTIDATVRYGVDFADLAERADLTGAAGSFTTIDLPRAHERNGAMPWAGLPERVVLLGLGAATPADLRRAGATLARATAGAGRVVTSAAGATGADEVRAFAEGYLLGAYSTPTSASSPRASGPAEQLVLLGVADDAPITAATVLAEAAWLARDLTNTPANLKNPAWFADQVLRLAQEGGLEVEVRDPDRLAEEGFGGLLAVGGGSPDGPRLVTVSYRPVNDAGEPVAADHVVLVGKGITYDTGGLSMKPRTAMVPMKTDMAGAAAVLAALLGAAALRVPHRVTAVLPLAENHVSGSAYRPGDVVTVYGGTRVEVANTDAEGRLVLADAIAFARAELSPDAIVDVATLTGAAAMGLGPWHGALYATDDALAARLESAAERTGEQVWRMPLVEDYRPRVESELADLRQVPSGRGAGSVTAALFLSELTGDLPWAHLDVAGPARSDKQTPLTRKGATGYGARLLLDYLAR
ncbi:MAG: leucyl aminopeptidase family protein [Cellulomonadaceae bacterium]